MKIGRLKNYDGFDQFSPLDVLIFETSLYYHTHRAKASQLSHTVAVPIQRAKAAGVSGLWSEGLPQPLACSQLNHREETKKGT